MKRMQTSKTAYKKWLKILTAIMFVGAVIGIIFWRVSANTSRTIVSPDINQPAPSNFVGQNNMNFIAGPFLPDVNNNREMQNPDSLIISYSVQSGDYAPAFRGNLTDADISKAVKITPFIKGEWTIRGPNTIVFSPATQWPANTKFTVAIPKSMFNGDVRPTNRIISVKTPPITAKIDSFNIYPDPAAPKKMTGVAIVSFNYPINTDNFKNKVTLKLDDKKLEFNVKFDRFHRTAFIISDPVDVSDTAQVMRMKLNRVPAAFGDDATQKITATATIESADNFFKISEMQAAAADDKDGNTQQLILINTTTAAAPSTQWAKYVNAYLLPARTDDETLENTPHKWQLDEITDSVLKKSEKLSLSPVDFATPNGVYQYALSFDVSEPNTRYIYVMANAGIKSAGGFMSKNAVTNVMRVPYPAKIVKIAGDGALLSLAGDRKLGIMARGGVNDAYINLYKIKSDEINHLISQTYNVFSKEIDFKSWSFGAYDMATVFQKKISFPSHSMKQTNYASIDLGDYLDRTHSDQTGIFLIQAGPTKNDAEYSDKRLILLTNLGIIRKVNLDGSSDVFVSELSTGMPAADVEISVLGRNGTPIWAGQTNASGHAITPRFAWSEYRNEKEPVAFVARIGDDVSFIPYNSPYDTRVEYSKFDIDGTFASNTAPMNAYIFSDRGIYRPGENIVIGAIIKNKAFKSVAGVPVKFEIDDPRGRIIMERTISLGADGMIDITHTISPAAQLGEYTARIYTLNSKNKNGDMLGYTTFNVEEFVPDTLKITANIPNTDGIGWISPENITADVSLRNLFGTPAAGARIQAHATLMPIEFSFPEYKDYIFTKNFMTNTGMSTIAAARGQTFFVDITDIKTDENGIAKFPIKFNQTIPNGTYALTLNLNGFDGNSGVNVQTAIKARVSNAEYLVGYSTNSDISYINRDDEHSVHLIALDYTGAPIAVSGLTQRLVQREKLTSLVKDYAGYYKYQTIERDRIVSQNPIDISEKGTIVNLDCHDTGTYFLQIMDSTDTVLANIEYYVAGEKNDAIQTTTTAQLDIKLKGTEFAAGNEIEMSITAPYAGAGLITIERDRVYAHKWFQSNSTQTVQTITIPADFEGTGYVNVSFVRDINSRDIFTTPYAYAVAPFRADIASRNIKIDLTAPSIVRDGKLPIEYKTDKDSKIMIFAVNQGILQVAKYKTPNPIAHFFQKAALQVETYQILSLLLPEYKILREFAKTGGGDYDDAAMDGAALTNPFGRKTTAPVAFYSGILNATANTATKIEFDIPEYFNGTLKIFAVAASENAMGSNDIQTIVQSPIVINTTLPLAVAPNDTFDVNTLISNLTEASGANAQVRTNFTANGPISITSPEHIQNTIAEGTDKLLISNIRAGDMPGAAELTVHANVYRDDKSLAQQSATATLSVRPISPMETFITTGVINSKNKTIGKFAEKLYPQFATRKLYISANAAALMQPLFEYLKKYDFDCTEQIVSRTLPYAVAPNDAILGTTYATSAEHIADAISELQNRQKTDGSFELWPGLTNGATHRANDSQTAHLTAYVVQFLTLAKKNGFNVPQNMLGRGIDYLRNYAGAAISDPADALSKSFAIYVITQNEYVTTGYINIFEEFANKNIKNWQSELSGAYIAASYKMMKQNERANAIFAKYKPSQNDKFTYIGQFDNNIANDAAFSYIARNYFDETPDTLSTLRAYINRGDYTSFTSAMAILGLAGDVSNSGNFANNISIFVNGKPLSGNASYGTFTAELPMNAEKIQIKCPECGTNQSMFYTILQQGFPTIPRPHANGIEITREYFNKSGDRITSGRIGDTVTVKINIRARGDVNTIGDVAIIDLLPGGFIAGDVSGDVTFYEIREDRVLIFTDVTRENREITYTAQLGAAGDFAIAPIHAQSINNPAIGATGTAGGKFTVLNAKSE